MTKYGQNVLRAAQFIKEDKILIRFLTVLCTEYDYFFAIVIAIIINGL